MATRKTLVTTVLVVAAAAGASVLGAAAPAGAAPQARDANAAAVHRSTQTPAQVAAYWTKARMAAVQTLPDAPLTAAKTRAAASAPAPAQTSKLGVQSGPGSLPRVRSASASTSATNGVTRTAASVNQSSVWYSHGVMPARTIGKLTFTDTAGVGHGCTASVIASGNGSMIWTAGHCVSDANGHWFSNFQFIPDYHDGVRPYGTWYARTWSSPNSYFHGGNQDYDMAALTLWTNNGQRVADLTGSQGYWFNGGYNWNVYEFGYPQDTHPARAGIDTNQLRYCYGSTWRTSVFYQQESIHCDMGHGASGGPFLTDLQFSRGWGYLVGNVSHHNSESSDEERSPYLGDAAVNVYNAQTNA